MFGRIKITNSTENYSEEIKRLKKVIEEADAIVIGAGAGLSTSAGFTYSGERFEKYFRDFGEKYCFKDMYSGGFYPYAHLHYIIVYVIMKEMRQVFMTNKGLNLQDVFLNQARKDRLPLTIFLTNGYQFKGIIRGFDSFIVILETDGRQQLVYKHAISTIVPARPISILDAMEQRDDAE